MSDHTGIPVSTLSKVEHDRLTLTYDKLLQLSQKLNIRISELFAESESADEGVTARRSIGRIDDSVRVTTPNYDYYYLCTELRRKRMVPILTRIRAKSLSQFGDLVRHSGEEYIHVLEGSIVVHSEFYDPVSLHTGEGIYIDSNMGHGYVADEGCDEALVLGRRRSFGSPRFGYGGWIGQRLRCRAVTIEIARDSVSGDPYGTHKSYRKQLSDNVFLPK